ncbi:MAG: outer membrane protein [Sphingomonadales bacterium]|jgi:Skp family chaperone for outer membrane proteins|nr:outer membrane protein [Sphingomonadales bacterium]
MNRYLISSALAALAIAPPAVLQAQALPPAVIAVVNRDQIASTCTPCVAATAQLRAQGTAYEARENQLATPLRAEGAAIQALVNALPQGGQPDAALGARIQTFQANSQAAERELGAAQQTLRRNQQHVVNQIIERMNPLIQQITRERGANVAIDMASTLAINPAIDVTPAVLALMNQNNAAFSVVAPPPAAPAAQPAQPPAAQPNRPRPQGR